MRRLLLVGLLAGALIGCNSSKRENVEPPAELSKIEPSVSVTRLWRQDLGKGERRLGLRQRPAVDGNRVFAADPKGNLYAFDAASGKSLWQNKTELRLSSSLGLGEDTLVVGTLDGQVVAYNPDSGSERWRAQVSSEVIAAPAIDRGLVIVRSIDGRVFAFSSTDGERRWAYDRGIPALTLRGNSTPLATEGVVLVGYDSGIIVALRGDNGTQIWEQTVGLGEGRTELQRMVDIDGDMALDQGELFAASFNTQVIALSLQQGGRPLWNRDVSSYAGIAVHGEKVLVADRDGTLWALDRGTGAALWKQESLAHRWLSTPAVQGNHVVVGDLEGYLHWFNLDDGKPSARQRLGDEPIRAALQVVNGVLYAVTIDGELAAYRLD